MNASAALSIRRWLWAVTPAVVLGAIVLDAGSPRGNPADRVRPPAAACGDDGFQRWLAARYERIPVGVAAKDERALIEALVKTGQKNVDRYIVARALHHGDPGRYRDSALAAELDEAALGFALDGMPAYRSLIARIRTYPGKAQVAIEIPGTKRPRKLSEEAAAPETGNELLEAIRSAPVEIGPPKRRDVDVFAELPALVELLGSDAVKSRALVHAWRERPEVFAPVFARHRTDRAFRRDLEAALGANLTALLRDAVPEFTRELLPRLERNGFPRRRLEVLAIDNPEAFDDIAASHVRSVLASASTAPWEFSVADGVVVIRATIGHFAPVWRAPLRDFVLGDGESRKPFVPLPASPFEVVHQCLGELCLPAKRARPAEPVQPPDNGVDKP
jgi:hypothetical protein